MNGSLYSLKFNVPYFYCTINPVFTKIKCLLLVFLFLSSIASKSVAQTCNSGGNQTDYGTGKWIGYVYQHSSFNSPISSPESNDYRGYVIENEVFDRNNGSSNPSCVNNDYFAVRYKMKKEFVCGVYTFVIGGDDGVRLSIDGGVTWLVSKWTNSSYATVTSNPITLNGSVNLVLEYFERTGNSRVSFAYNDQSFASAVNAGTDQYDCGVNSIVLNGSFLANDPNPSYSWSGGPIVSGGNTLTPEVNPTVATDYTLTVTSEGCSATDDVHIDIGGAIAGNPSDFGDNFWNVYAYNGSSTTLSNNSYRGYYKQPALSAADYGVDTEQFWRGNESPVFAGSTLNNGDLWQGCNDLTKDNHTVVHKRIGFPCGKYTFKFHNWDDETRLFINGNRIWSCAVWDGSPGAYSNSNNSQYSCDGTTNFVVDLDGSSKVEFHTFEGSGDSDLKVSITKITPTALSGSTQKTCYVKGSEWNDFYNDQNELIASINPNGIDLGNVTMESFLGLPLVMESCTSSNPIYHTAYMGRRWVMVSSAYPNGHDFGNSISVRLPYAESDLVKLNDEAENSTTSNNFDGGSLNPATNSNLMLTKITGSTENGVANQSDCSSNIRAVLRAGGGANLYGLSNTEYVDFNINQFSEFFLHKNNGGSALPIELTSFSARCNDVIKLEWETASEQNSDYFVIESSRDGIEWEEMGMQKAAGNSSISRTYRQIDDQLTASVKYYRLKQIDLDGKERVYGPISVICDNIKNEIKVFPNPNQGQFTVEVLSNADYKDVPLILTDVTGKVLLSKNVDIALGTTHFKINNLDLQKGTYFIKLLNDKLEFAPLKVVVL
ncbi:T9SS type A sorting domain-containing protein [Brumimicrobium aurantiacum]|uniref:T9SS C-terminal target domain-containing protein n=1 Tax=Brumimicrobium aurantiacum TaxID=1737063 RepID=A0A3E1EXX0_9FLAO|nr:T9SS type A sorting domain-containing protein [Brumimicrobium aurantiacum]RFC54410.1 T9SS C-terminal target domain-containing protein [Brumimicrobium aurantiacum]